MIRMLVSCVAVAGSCFLVTVQVGLSAELQPGDDVVLARNYSIHSEILGEDRNVLIYLPASYGAEASRERHYPVLYLLDGPAYFHATTGIAYHLGDASAAVQRIPEQIVVAVRNIRTNTNATRTRDMTPSHVTAGLYSENSGGAAQFRAFLESELIPQIDSQFRTQTKRILVGHSLAGLFTLDTLIERPQMFAAYIAIDPTASWDENLLSRKLNGRGAEKSLPAVSVFIAEANTPSKTPAEEAARRENREGIQSFRAALEKSGGAVQKHYRFFADETHLSIPLVGIYAGLLAVYADHEEP